MCIYMYIYTHIFFFSVSLILLVCFQQGFLINPHLRLFLGDGQGHGLMQQILLIAVYAEPCQT